MTIYSKTWFGVIIISWFSPKVGDNLNNFGGTNKDDSHTPFSKNTNISASPNSHLNGEEEYFQQLVPRKRKIKRKCKNINELMEMTKPMLLVDVEKNYHID